MVKYYPITLGKYCIEFSNQERVMDSGDYFIDGLCAILENEKKEKWLTPEVYCGLRNLIITEITNCSRSEATNRISGVELRNFIIGQIINGYYTEFVRPVLEIIRNNTEKILKELVQKGWLEEINENGVIYYRDILPDLLE